MTTLSKLIAEAGEDNTDNSLFTAEQQKAFWDAVNDGGVKFADVAGEDEAKESLQERSKAKVPGEKSWTKNNCHIIINAKLQ